MRRTRATKSDVEPSAESVSSDYAFNKIHLTRCSGLSLSISMYAVYQTVVASKADGPLTQRCGRYNRCNGLPPDPISASHSGLEEIVSVCGNSPNFFIIIDGKTT